VTLTFEEFREVVHGVEADSMAVADQGVERGGTFAALRVAHEEPVFLPDGAGTDRVLDKVVVDLHAPVAGEHAQLAPLPEGVADGFAGEAARQMHAACLQALQPAFDGFEDGDAVFLSCCACLQRTGAGFSHPRFDAVERLHLREHPAGVFAFLLGFVKFAPRMGHASGELDVACACGLLDEAVVGFVAVALDEAGVVLRHDLLKACAAAPGVPGHEADVAHGVVHAPQIAGAAHAFAFGVLILDRCLVDLHIAIFEDLSLDLLDDEACCLVRHAHPAAKRLPRHGQALAGVELLDAVIWQVHLEA